MLSLTECVREFRNNALLDTHYITSSYIHLGTFVNNIVYRYT